MKLLENRRIATGVSKALNQAATVLIIGLFISVTACAQNKAEQKASQDGQDAMKATTQAQNPTTQAQIPTTQAQKPTAVEFKSLDGLLISGILYEVGKDNPVILLCHQAGYNKAEYADIAPKLNEMGYNCLAVDQRSGGELKGKPNETANRAKAKGLPSEFTDAHQDITAAIAFLSDKYDRQVIIWGSSYSSSLVLFESLENNDVKASLSFSPGDYFGKAKPALATVFSKIEKPFFVTSSKQEAKKLNKLIDKEQLKENQIHFIPTADGFHGSKALWTGQKGADEYWAAVIDFLKSIKEN